MSGPGWMSVRRVLEQALEIHPQRRSAFLDEACAGDAALRVEVERLLALEAPASKRIVPPAAPHGSAIPAGARIGGYRLLGVLAAGGMGTVYEAEQESPHRRVALKVMRFGFHLPEDVARFRFEAEILGRLQHPGIAQVFESGVHSEEVEVPYFAMEFVEGARTILEHARERKQGVRERLELFLQVCDAVHHGHQKGVIHRDLKPGNLLVDAQGRVKVIDFGIARAATADSSLRSVLTETGRMIGTLHYMSPEQFGADPAEIDSRADVYALGLVLHELLAGRLPYDLDEKPIHEVARIVCSEPPEKLRRADPGLPGDLEWIAGKALEKERERRYGSASDLAADIRRHLAHEPVLAGPPTATYRLSKFVRRHAIGVAAACGIGIALLLGIAGTTIGMRRAEDESRQVLRMSDVQRLRGLRERAATLWPPRPARIPEYERWLAEARALEERLDAHESRLGDLRARAGAWTEDERRADRAAHPLRAEIAALGDHAERHRRGLVSEENCSDGTDAHLEDLERRKALLEARTDERLTWSMPTPEEQWQHDTLAAMTADLRDLRDPEHGLVRDVAARMESARTIAERSVSGAEASAAWSRARASIADPAQCPAYAGLALAPQMGLVPVEKDGASGLWEFACVETGRVPVRDRATGRLAMDGESAVVLVLLPGGRFRMGAQSDPALENYDPEAYPAESPTHEVELAPYFISKFEMTQGQWLRLAGSNPSYYSPGHENPEGTRFGLSNPVESVNLDEYLEILRRAGLDVPTEAQWEYAARARTGTPYSTGETRESLAGFANLCDRLSVGTTEFAIDPRDVVPFDDGEPMHAPVGRYAPNPFGLHDVHGNVEEVCADAGFYEMPVRAGDGRRAGVSTLIATTRGGCYCMPTFTARSAFRHTLPRNTRDVITGVRPARAIE